MPTLSVASNTPIAADVWRMELLGDIPQLASGSFVELSVPGYFLRRPFSVCASSQNHLTLIYKIVGKGTAQMAQWNTGHQTDVLVGLGNGFDCSSPGKRFLLVGGGLGVAPLYQLARTLHDRGAIAVLAAGFQSGKDIFLKEEFSKICESINYATADGSVGQKGLVTELLPALQYDYFYACGPLPMLRAVQAATYTDGQLSLEARMGCGFGICMGCSVQTVNGPKRVCKEGPVFGKEELVW